MYMVMPPGWYAIEIDIETEKQARAMARFIYDLGSLPNGTKVIKM